MRRCLTCEQEMETKILEGVEIDTCPDGHGLWLDEGEFTRLSGIRPREVVLRQCPACDSPMANKYYPDVQTNVCFQCSRVWLEGNEIARLGDMDPELTGHDMGGLVAAVKVDLEEDGDYPCLECGQVMKAGPTTGGDVARCPDGDGALLDGSVFQETVQFTPIAGRMLQCPNDDEVMSTRLYSNTEIDICSRCSAVWLDAGELMLIADLNPVTGARNEMKRLLSRFYPRRTEEL